MHNITRSTSQQVYGFVLGIEIEKKTFKWILNQQSNHSSLRQCLHAASDEFLIALRTLYYWWKHYQFYEEFPSETRAFYDWLRRKVGYFKYGDSIFSDNHLLQMLKDIIDKHPKYYFDQFVHASYWKSNILVSPNSINRCLHDQLNYRILAVQKIVQQRNEDDRELCKSALLEILEHLEIFILVDETHKDKNASRRK